VRVFDLVIFDCDGVLVDSEPVANQILGAYLNALGLEMSASDIMAEYVGLSMKSVVEKIECRLGRPLPADWLDRLQQDTFAAFAQELHPVTGVRQVVEAVKARGQKFCVASSGSIEKITLTLTLTGLYPAFEGRIFSASQVANGKPAPDLFLFAAANCGTNPKRALVIEDSLPGVKAAFAAGMTACGYAARGQAEVLQSAGARTFTDMKELGQWLAEAGN
jgi:HAD superfamily hydrolase (TIGR01509 family)